MKILCVRNDKLGDFVLTIPLYQLLKRRYPSIHITVLVAGYVAPFAKSISDIDEVIIDHGGIWHLIKEIRSKEFDVSLTIFSTGRIGWILFLSNIKQRIAPATKIAQIFHNKTKRQKRSAVKMREFEYNVDLLTLLDHDIDINFNRPVIEINEQDKINALKNSGIVSSKKLVALHPGSGGSSIGNLDIDQYLELAKIIQNHGMYEPVFTFGPDESDLLRKVQGRSNREYLYYQSNSGILEFCALLKNFALFISTSTGTMHLAGAVNIPTFSFFGNHIIASSRRWSGLNEDVYQNNFNLTDDNGSDFEKIQISLKELL